MLRRGISPNKFTFTFLLKACAGAQIVSQAHASAIKLRFGSDRFVQHTLIHAYAVGGGGLCHARKVFDGMPDRDRVAWSAMIGGYVRSGRPNDAVALFRGMQASRVCPDEVTMLTLLSACADLGALELARWIKSYVEREDGGITKTVPLCNAMVDALAKCGDIDGAVKLFDRMPQRSIVSWTAVIDGLARHGRGCEAVDVFEAMKRAAVVPDDVVFIGVLYACSHAGMVEQGRLYFDSMKADYGIEPKIEHYGCMVDLYSRAGLLDQAMAFIETMPVKPNPIIWRTLIGGCRLHGRLELGESLVRRLIDTEPKNGPNYVLLSNVYASTRRWEKKSEVRKAMCDLGIKKDPGCSSVELDGVIYEFTAGDDGAEAALRSNEHMKGVFDMLEEMEMELRRAGYSPTTAEVMLDVGDEEKEGALRRHSERFAIAFALMRTTPGTTIRVVKNLRVCGDCHSATKIISSVYGREIVVRDRSRFHFFKDGACSCRDFW